METARYIESEPTLENKGVLAAYEIFNQATTEAEAWRLIQCRDSLPVVEVKPQERHDNARTAIMEALTASGHLSRIELTGSVEEINVQVTSRLINGWDDSLPIHEKQRRFSELCEELTIQKVHRGIVAGELPPDTAVSVISDYPEAMSELEATKLGYRASNKKGMVRSTHLQVNPDGSYTRVIEQVSRSNGNWRSTYGFMSENGIKTIQGTPDLVALQTPLIYTGRDYVDGVVDVIRRLDQLAGPNVIYGDNETKTNHVPYNSLRYESARREQEVEGYVIGLARLEEQLDNLQAKGMNRAEREIVFKEEVDRILTAICTLQPDYAEDTYGKKAAGYFYTAADLVARGDVMQAQQLLQDTQHLKQTVTFCGMSISVDTAKKMGLEISSFGELIDKGKESWQWKTGICQVESCPTRPGKTLVGPCSVCKKCQAEFDRRKDPTKTKTTAKIAKPDNYFKKTDKIAA